MATKLFKKVQEYAQAGVQLVWIVNPVPQTVQVYRQDNSITKLRAADQLSGEQVVSEFHCRVSELFPSVVEEDENQEDQ